MKSFDQFLDSLNEAFDPKDEMRISDIVTKSKGDEAKQIQLATAMANKITDVEKAERRGEAAEDQGLEELASIFYNRANQLDGGSRKVSSAIDAAEEEEELKAVATKELKPKKEPVGKPKVGDFFKVSGNMIAGDEGSSVQISDGKAWRFITAREKGDRQIEVNARERRRYGGYYDPTAYIDSEYLKEMGNDGIFYIEADKVGPTWIEGRVKYTNGLDETNYRARVMTKRIVPAGPELKIFQEDENSKLLQTMKYAKKFFIGDEDFVMNKEGKSFEDIVPGSYQLAALDFNLSVTMNAPVVYCVPENDRNMKGARVFFAPIEKVKDLSDAISPEQLSVVAEWMGKQIGAEVKVTESTWRGPFSIPYFRVTGSKMNGFLSGYEASPFFTREQAEEEIKALKEKSKTQKLPYSTDNLEVRTYGTYDINFSQLMDYAKLCGIEVKLRKFFEEKRGAIQGKKFGF